MQLFASTPNDATTDCQVHQAGGCAMLTDANDWLRIAMEAASLEAFEYDAQTGWTRRRGKFKLEELGLPELGPAADYLAHLHPADREPYMATLNGLTPAKPSYRLEYRVATPGGHWHWKTDSGVGRFDAAGQLLKVIGICQDVTLQYERQQTLAYVMDATGDGLWDWRVNDGIVRHNLGWCRALGLGDHYLEHPIDNYQDLLHPDDVAAVQSRIEACLRGEAAFYSEHRMRCGDGHYIWVLDRGNVVERDAQGRPTRVVGSFSDVTERKRAEEQLRQSRQEIAQLADNAPDIIARFDRTHRHVFVNAIVEHVIGKPIAHFIGKTTRELGYPPDFCQQWDQFLEHIFQTQKSAQLEFEFPTVDGVRYFSATAVPEFDDKGSVQTALCFTRDVTAKRLAETARHYSEELFRATFEQAAVGLAHVGLDGRFLRVNQKLCDIVGYTHDTLLPLSFQQITHPDDLDADLANVTRMLAGEVANFQMEKRYLRADHTPVWASLTVSLVRTPDGAPDYFIAVIEDIQERKALEVALTESEQRFRDLANTAPAMLWVGSPEGGGTFVSRGWLDFTGQSEAEALGDGFLNAIHPEDRDTIAAQYQAAYARQQHLEGVFRVRRADGVYRWVLDQGRARFDAAGNYQGYVGAVIDITERKEAEAALLRTTALLSEAQKIAHMGSFEFIAGTARTIWSEEEYRIYGLDPSRPSPDYPEMLAKCIHPDEAELLQRTFSDAIRNQTIYELEHRIVRPDGSVRWVYDRAKPYFDDAGNLLRYVGATLDITDKVLDRKALEAATAAAEYANDAKTRFLATASHDLRQPVQAMRLLLSVLQGRMENPQEARKVCVRMDGALAATESLLTRLMEFAALESGKIAVCRTQFALDAMLQRIAHEQTNEAVAKGLKLRIRSFPCDTDSDSVLLERIVRNLLVNAIRYTAKGGILLAMRRRHDKVLIEVRDTGPGIPPDEQAAIFEEFYQIGNTARETAKGAGLGLAIVARTAQLLGHPVSLASTVDRGSLFTISVPALKPGNPSSDTQDGVMQTPHKTHVILVEDDAAQAIALEMVLNDKGYAVRVAKDGISAVRIVREEGFVPDFMISDYRLPGGLSGVEVVVRIRALVGHDLPAVIVTGDTLTQIADAAFAARCTILHKPYSLNDLLGQLDKMQALMT